MTGLAGLPVYLDLPHMMGLPERIGRHLQVKQRGWTDAQVVLALKSWKPFSVTRYSGECPQTDTDADPPNIRGMITSNPDVLTTQKQDVTDRSV
ncbi:MAG: hypothetical protein WC347_03245 [Smithellaceae bacterium]|jgi:hypothetical protein